MTPVLVAQYPQQSGKQPQQQQNFTAIATTNSDSNQKGNSNNNEMVQSSSSYMTTSQDYSNLSQFVLLSPALPKDGKSFTAGMCTWC